MKIGIDCRAAADSAGIGEYTRQSVKHIINQNSHDEFVLFFADAKTAEKFKGDKVKIIILPFYKYKKFLPLVYSQLIVPWLMNNRRLDVCWFPANIIPLGYRGRAVVTIHDLAVYTHPELFPDKLINFDRRYLVPSSLRRANKIIAVSNSTKQDIIKLFKIPADKIEMIYEGFESTEFVGGGKEALKKYDLENKKYLLFVGTIEPRKNLVRLIMAFEEFCQNNTGYELVLAGKSGWKNEEIFQAIKEANQRVDQDRIKYLGYVSAEDKKQLLKNASIFVFPSLYEGFGLPIIEAMALGVPVITSNVSSLPEVVGEAGVLVDPLSTQAIVGAIKKIADNENFRQSLISLGKKRFQIFTWDLSIQKTLEILKVR